MNQKKINQVLKEQSGNVKINSKLVCFLYLLMRDHLPLTDVETLVRQSQDPDCEYTNGWAAKYAENLADRLK